MSESKKFSEMTDREMSSTIREEMLKVALGGFPEAITCAAKLVELGGVRDQHKDIPFISMVPRQMMEWYVGSAIGIFQDHDWDYVGSLLMDVRNFTLPEVVFDA